MAWNGLSLARFWSVFSKDEFVPDWVKSATDFIKLSPRWLAPLALVAAVALFSPPRWIALLGLDTLVSSYRGWIGAAFLLLVALLLAAAAESIWTRLSRSWAKSSAEKKAELELIDRLGRLADSEVQIVRFLLVQDIAHLPDTGYVTRLRHTGIIRRVTADEFELAPAVKELLVNHPDYAAPEDAQHT
jgi:hypothetical protein